MSENQALELRLSTLEAEVASLKRELHVRDNGPEWVRRVSGSLKAYPEFDEVARLGNEIRKTSATQ